MFKCKQNSLPNSHNTHHYLEFFKVIRQSIAGDKFDELMKLISQQETAYELINAEQNNEKTATNISSDSAPFKKFKNEENID